MKNFLIISNSKKDINGEIAELISNKISTYGGNCNILRHLADTVISEKNVSDINNIECVITIGGDGTFIKAVRDLSDRNFKYLGINMGTLGYLAEINPEEFDKIAERLINDKYDVEERIMLEGTIEDTTYKEVALNDVIVHSFGTLKVIKFNIYVNGKLLGLYTADGVIISTPTGSTAYNLSAGGPIVKPDANLILITPICPHSTNGRSIILDDSDEIVVEVCNDNESEVAVTFDGNGIVKIPSGKSICIKKAGVHTDIIKFGKQSFLEILKSKMGDK